MAQIDGGGVSVFLVITEDTLQRWSFVRGAVNSFVQNLYPEKELIIVNPFARTVLDTDIFSVKEVRPSQSLQGAPIPHVISALRHHASMPWMGIMREDEIWPAWSLAYRMGHRANTTNAVGLTCQTWVSVKLKEDATRASLGVQFATSPWHPATTIFPICNLAYWLQAFVTYGSAIPTSHPLISATNLKYPFNMASIRVMYQGEGAPLRTEPVDTLPDRVRFDEVPVDYGCLEELKNIIAGLGYELDTEA